MSIPTHTSVGLAWTIDGPPFIAPTERTFTLSWTVDGPPLPSTILVKASGDLAQVPFLVKAGGTVIDPSTNLPWTH